MLFVIIRVRPREVFPNKSQEFMYWRVLRLLVSTHLGNSLNTFDFLSKQFHRYAMHKFPRYRGWQGYSTSMLHARPIRYKNGRAAAAQLLFPFPDMNTPSPMYT